MRRWLLLALAGLIVFLLGGVRYLVNADPGRTTLEPGRDHKTLVVFMRGLAGAGRTEALSKFVRSAYPDADFLTSTVTPSTFANIDPYLLSDIMEQDIASAYGRAHYDRIVLVGFSMGAAVLRKALVWGHGWEQDRTAQQGRHEWVDHVERFVSLAGLNRGWSIEEKPESRRWYIQSEYYIAEKIARLTGTGGMLLSMQRGAPFVADLRVQWMNMTREQAKPDAAVKLPFVVHLLGDIDDVVAREDSQDINVATDTKFITLLRTDHAGMADVEGDDPYTRERREKIFGALTKAPADITTDKAPDRIEDTSIHHLVFVYHGIRDYAPWENAIRNAVLTASQKQGGTAVVAARYGYFPMMPFLLYWDRQKNVRAFMDQYTEELALYPELTQVDYVGHSNGTYILASALQQYRTLKVNNIFFAGSVVPRYYDWSKLISQGRVSQVRNVVASADWVVAYFPRFFEQIADWTGDRSCKGLLDLGSAGFHGFEADATQSKVQNLEYLSGGHSAGVDVAADSGARLAAIVGFVMHRDDDLSFNKVFENTGDQSGFISTVSNVSWLVWLIIAAILIALGRFSMLRFGARGLAIYVLVLLGLFNSV